MRCDKDSLHLLSIVHPAIDQLRNYFTVAYYLKDDFLVKIIARKCSQNSHLRVVVRQKFENHLVPLMRAPNTL